MLKTSKVSGNKSSSSPFHGAPSTAENTSTGALGCIVSSSMPHEDSIVFSGIDGGSTNTGGMTGITGNGISTLTKGKSKNALSYISQPGGNGPKSTRGPETCRVYSSGYNQQRMGSTDE
jgi:hypothetical protein